MTLGATTELQAVNLILGAIGEASVATIDDPTHEDASSALELIRNSSRRIQSEGWHFNTDEKYPLTPDVNGFIFPPANYLQIDTDYLSADIDVVVRGGKLYNKTTNSHVFEGPITVNIILGLDYADLPQAARDYVLEDAGLQFIQGDLNGSQGIARFSLDRAQKARVRLLRFNKRTGDRNMLRDNPDIARIQYGRRQNLR